VLFNSIASHYTVYNQAALRDSAVLYWLSSSAAGASQRSSRKVTAEWMSLHSAKDILGAHVAIVGQTKWSVVRECERIFSGLDG
jgi:hypothetical protein